MKRNMHGDIKSKEREGRVYSDSDSDSGEEYVKVEASNGSNGKEVKVEERINALVLKHLSSVLGEHTIKVIGYHLSSMGVDIRDWCDEPKKVEDALYVLFKEGSRMLIAEVVKMLYTEFNIMDGESTTLEDAIKRIKALDR